MNIIRVYRALNKIGLCLLPMAALWIRIQTSLKNTKLATSKGVANKLLPKKYTKKTSEDLFSGSSLLVKHSVPTRCILWANIFVWGITLSNNHFLTCRSPDAANGARKQHRVISTKLGRSFKGKWEYWGDTRSVAYPDPGSDAFFYSGSGMEENPDPGWGENPNPEWGKKRIRHPGWTIQIIFPRA